MLFLIAGQVRGFATRLAVRSPQVAAPSAARARAPTTRLMSAAAWEALGLSSDMSGLVSKQWPEPNAVQRAALPALLQAEDDAVVGAETGSGKTLAYLLPAAQRAVANRRKHTPYPAALVLVPNRELGTQLRRVAARLGADTQPPFADESKLFSLEARHGGALARWPYGPGKAPDVLVATPSFAAAFDRDLDLWEGLSTLVLDEADMLLDGGFKRQLDRCLVALKRVERRREGGADLVDDVPERCRRVVVAATLPNQGLRSVDGLVTKYFANATRCADLPMHGVVSTLEHVFESVSGDDERDAKLGDLLESTERTMVFCKTSKRAASVAERLALDGVAAAPYTKDVDPERRLATLDLFASAKINVLVCTDLAARGLDLPEVKRVVQYDFATDAVSHLHRVGRAARAGAAASAVSFVDSSNTDLVEALERGDTVEHAFSRRRGLRKKLRKERV